MESPDNAHLSPFGPVIPTSSVPSWEGATNPNQGAKDPDPGIALLGLLPTLEVWFVAFLVFFLLGDFLQENNQNCSYTINWHQVTSRNYDVDVDTIETVLIQVWKIYIGTYLQSLKQSRLNAQILNV